MLALEISSTKQFMNCLLAGDCFSSFLLESASVTTFNTFTIDGRIHRDFYDSDEQASHENTKYDFSPYLSVQEYLFTVIKGSRTPLQLKVTLLLNPDATEKLLQNETCTVSKEQIAGFVLNIKYDGTKITLTTAISYSGFTMDKSAEPIWDTAFKKFLAAKDIKFEEII